MTTESSLQRQIQTMKKNISLIFLLSIFFISTSVKAYQPAVASAQAQASKVGLEILKKGGNAADAAIATAFALSVVEPYNSGLGGGGFLVYYDANKKTFSFIDYREVAPQKARSSFYKKNPQALVLGIHAAAVPGFVKGMESIHQSFGSQDWKALIEPSVQLSEKAFPYRGMLREKILLRQETLSQDPDFKKIFIQAGSQEKSVIQKELAKTLRLIQSQGSDSFYKGEIANKITSFMKEKGGFIQSRDLTRYKVIKRKPHEFSYKNYKIITASSPSSGGLGLEMFFKQAEADNLSQIKVTDPRAYELIIQNFKKYFAARQETMGGIFNEGLSQTTHLSVIDKNGNMAAMTNSLNYPFGSGVMVPGTGIILNNHMADFSIEASSKKNLNPIKSGQRPLSSMSPTLVFKDQKPHLIIGTPGGTTIPQTLAQVLFSFWEWKMPLWKAIRKERIFYSPTKDEILFEKPLHLRIQKALEKIDPIASREKVGNVQAVLIQSQTKSLPHVDHRGEGEGYSLR